MYHIVNVLQLPGSQRILRKNFVLALATSILPSHGSVLTVLYLSRLAMETVVKGWRSEDDFSWEFVRVYACVNYKDYIKKEKSLHYVLIAIIFFDAELLRDYSIT